MFHCVNEKKANCSLTITFGDERSGTSDNRAKLDLGEPEVTNHLWGVSSLEIRIILVEDVSCMRYRAVIDYGTEQTGI